jgi:uncharacterized protein (DUF488 family)
MSGPFTIGHSTRTADELLALLRAARIETLVDVRRYPASRRFPQFGRDALERALRGAGIAYEHEPDLGGRREPIRDSPNTSWRAGPFRGYADHMATPLFAAALDRLLERAHTRRVAVMCAEASPSRCHRQLIADAVVARGMAVTHLLAPGESERHRLNAAARVDERGVLVYPAAGQKRLFPAPESQRRGSRAGRPRPR